MRKIEQIWTVGEVIKWTQGYFEKKGVENPRNTTEKLMEMLLKMDKTHLYINWKEEVEKVVLSDLKRLMKKVLEGVPVAYLTKKERFYSFDFQINESVLIPRPETEELVEWVIKDCRDIESLKILDLGTGSGVIAITLARLLKHPRIIATDIDSDCIATAKDNAMRNGVLERIEFFTGDFFDPVNDMIEDIDVIVSNPPYISMEDKGLMDEKVLLYEPHKALFAEENGLDFYNRIAQKAMALKGKTVYLEAGFNQKEYLERLFGDNLIDYKRDMNGNWRMLKLKM